MIDKPHILFIVPLPPPVHGSSMMNDYIRQCEEINSRFYCDFVNLSTSRSIDEIGSWGLKKLLRIGTSLCSTFWNLLTGRYDKCYIAMTCHGNGFLKDAPFALMCKLFGKKLIIHQHNKGMSRDLKSWWRRWLLKSVYRNSTIVLLSWRLYPDIEEIVDRSQIRICPNGIPVDEAFDTVTPRDNPKVKLLFLSNLIPSKGVYVLLDALKILKDNGYAYECHFVGGETKEISAATFEQAVGERGLTGRAIYLGKKYGVDKTAEFKEDDIFVFPTFYNNETFGLVNLEAMQAAMPVISTEEAAIPDIVIDGETGLICEKENAQSLAEKIAYLIDNPEIRRKMGIKGRERFLKHFTIENFTENLSNILSE